MTADMNRSVDLTLTADDYVAANKLHVLNVYRGHLRLAMTAAGVLFYVFFIVSDYVGGWSFWPFAGVIHLFALWLLLMPFLSYFLIAPGMARKNFRKQKSLQQPLTWSWSEAGLKVTNDGGAWLTPWDHYLKRADNAEMFLFYQAPRLFQMVPKRALSAEQQADLGGCADRVAG
ncbi:YcxB-like protein [Bosea sp. OK403]|uniref:YcxB family protein n=1 Tax=Bosea sp. OK403 TaxID=1855286 RepID=UPI0008E0F357|nr:YcxB family protein [Bosea sp. OK403]SFI40736.1 YcxB-like protein [Bosea sp. OK403]